MVKGRIHMKSRLLLIMLLALILIALAPVQAITITMSNPGGIAQRDIAVYFPNGTMYGYYNASSVIDLDVNSSYLFTLKPIQANPLEDPGQWMSDTIDYAQTHVTGLILIFFFIGLAGFAIFRRT